MCSYSKINKVLGQVSVPARIHENRPRVSHSMGVLKAVIADNLTRIYKSFEKDEGLKGTFKVLFNKGPDPVMPSPAQFLSDALEGRYWAMSIGVCAVFMGLCILLWRKGLRMYGSASS